MKKLGLLMMLLLLSRIALFCQAQTAGIEEKEVLRNEDVIFHQIDEHTWFGTGHLMANESLYLVEGDTKAILIDAGTKIKDLDKLVASITDKPVTLVATHVHPDHTGSAIDYFPEIYINPADTILITSEESRTASLMSANRNSVISVIFCFLSISSTS